MSLVDEMVKTFDEWMREVRQLAVAEFGFTEEAAASIDEAAYRRDYFDEGCTAREALTLDLDDVTD